MSIGLNGTLLLLLASSLPASHGCSSSHQPPLECSVDGSAEDCPEGEVCRSTLDGIGLCMETCETNVCDSGAACVGRAPGPDWVCWVGGPRERGEPCDHDVRCGFGLRCNREWVCERACTQDTDCDGTGLTCEGVCQAPAIAGTLCTNSHECRPRYVCEARAGYTCQPDPGSCDGGTCPDGRDCVRAEDCWVVTAPEDACQRDEDGSSSGCRAGEVCAMTPTGVRRCMRAGCSPDGSHDFHCWGACLPDLEGSGEMLCWSGGETPDGGPCIDSYECEWGSGCNTAGVCAYACYDEGEVCRTLSGHTCRDHVCTPEGA